MAGRARWVLAAGLVALAIGLAAGPGTPRAWAAPGAADVSGGLATLGATVSGVGVLSFEVTGDPGAASAALIVDGTTVQTEPIGQSSVSFELDTATLKDGSHSLQATVTDEGGGGEATTTIVWAGAIETENAPAGGQPSVSGDAQVGQTLVADDGTWSPGATGFAYQWLLCDAAGSGCAAIAGATAPSYTIAAADADDRLAVSVTASNFSGSASATAPPSRVVADLDGYRAPPPSPAPRGGKGPGNGAGACARATVRARLDGAASVTVGLGRSVTLRGSLRCGARPIADASVAVAVVTLGGSGAARHATITTTATGRFDYVLGPGPSRRISVSYRADAAAAAANASATMRVRPRISLAITPRRTANGHTITFRGVVSGGHAPREGVTLDVEYLEGRRWMIYDTVRASPTTGRFVWRYTFRRTTESITYWFRIAIPTSGVSGYPFQPTASPARSVHVVP